MSSFPLRPCGYDLVVDTGADLFRVQVKQAQWDKAREARPGISGGDRAGWLVDLTLKRRAGGKAVREQRPVNHYDLLAVVCTPEVVYVIPESVLRVERGEAAVLLGQIKIRPELPETNKGGRQSSVLRWQSYLNQFVLTGRSAPARESISVKAPKVPTRSQALLVKKCRCGHSQTMHAEGTGRCDFCLTLCRAYQEAV